MSIDEDTTTSAAEAEGPAEPLVQAPPPPRTRTCRVCGVEINAASARCPYCGTRQFKIAPILGWRGLLVCLVAVAGAVLITRAVIDAGRPRPQYDSYVDSNLSALVPVGWKSLQPAGPHGTALAAFQGPGALPTVNGQASTVPTGDGEAIAATLDPKGSPHARILALAAALKLKPGVARSSIYAVTFPGGEAAWSILYTLDRDFYEVFDFDSCAGKVGVSVSISATSDGELNDLASVLAGDAQPQCNGPAFSNRDRADANVPLAPR